MISMVKLHFYYLFSHKVFYISLMVLIVSCISFLFFSSFYLDYELLLFDKQYYLAEYYFESINYIKIVILVFNMFLVINTFLINNYDLLLLIRRNRKEVIMSKILSLLLISSTFTFLLFLAFLITGLFLTPYMNITIVDVSILGDLTIFGIVYLMFFILVYSISEAFYSLLIVIVGYFISDITLEYYVLKENVSVFSKIINVVLVNIGYYIDDGYELYYGKIWGIIIIFSLFFINVTVYLKTDIKN